MIEESTVHPYQFKPKNNNPFRIQATKKKCPHCLQLATAVIVGDGSVSYYKCQSCNYVDPSFKFMSVTESSPLGSSNPDALKKPAKFRVIEQRRTVHSARKRSNIGNRRVIRNQEFTPTEDPVPLLAGKPDRDLEMLLSEHNGILVSVIDDNVDGQDVSYTNYREDSD